MGVNDENALRLHSIFISIALHGFWGGIVIRDAIELQKTTRVFLRLSLLGVEVDSTVE